MTTLTHGQWQLDSGPVFGDGIVRYIVEGYSIGESEADNGADPNSREDGRRFGYDYFAGRTITIDLAVSAEDEATAQSAYNELRSWWHRKAIRHTAGATSTLRYARAGRHRRVFGRGRKFLPNHDLDYKGLIKVTATFDTDGPEFYSDVLNHAHTTLVPPESQVGFTVPYTMPLTFVGESFTQGEFTVGGSEDAPLILRINGPIANPSVTLVDHFDVELRGTLAADDWVEINPLERTVLSRFGVNWAGEFTADSQHLPDIALPPGPAQVVLRGTDNTGTASLDTYWYDTFAAF